MTDEEALRMARAVRDEIFRCYGGALADRGSVSVPHEGDWVLWIARAIQVSADGGLKKG